MAGEWKEEPLSALCAYLNRGVAPAYTDKGGLLVLNQKCVRNQRVDFTAARRTDPERKPICPERILCQFDILVNSTGVGTLGRVAQIRKLPEQATIDSHLTLLRPDPRIIDPLYLGIVVRCFESEIEALGEGSTGQTELSRALLGAFTVPVPAKRNEQLAIAHILGTLDDKIELNRRMNETLEEMARALFKSWFVDFDPVRAKAEGRDTGLPKHIADLFPARFVDSELGEIPEGWGVSHFADTVEILGGGTPKTSVAEYWNGDIPWFSVVDSPNRSDMWVVETEKKITRDGIENSSTQILSVGTTIISARGTVGRIALVGVPMAMNQSCYGIRGKAGSRGFFTYFTTSELVVNLQQHAHGSVFDTITRETLAGISVAVPPIKIIDAFESRVGPALDRIRTGLLYSRTLATLRDMLLPKLISGELRIKDAENFIKRVIE